MFHSLEGERNRSFQSVWDAVLVLSVFAVCEETVQIYTKLKANLKTEPQPKPESANWIVFNRNKKKKREKKDKIVTFPGISPHIDNFRKILSFQDLETKGRKKSPAWNPVIQWGSILLLLDYFSFWNWNMCKFLRFIWWTNETDLSSPAEKCCCSFDLFTWLIPQGKYLPFKTWSWLITLKSVASGNFCLATFQANVRHSTNDVSEHSEWSQNILWSHFLKWAKTICWIKTQKRLVMPFRGLVRNWLK